MTSEEWKRCEDGALMLRLLGKEAGPAGSERRRPLVLAACECARLALPYVQKGEARPLVAIETAEKWARGEGVNLKWVRGAAAVALACVQDAISSHTHAASFDAAVAASAAASAASADAHSANAATYAANAAFYAASAASIFANDATRTAHADVLRKCADIVRKYFPDPPAGANM